MLLNSWFPFFDVAKTLDEVDRIFGTRGAPLGLRSVPRGTFPAMNVYDRGESVVLTAEIPGVKADDLDLSVLNDSVTLKGQRNGLAGEKDRYYRRERPTGSFSRTITLPDPIDPDSVKAEYNNGVLKVTMSKAAEAKAKKIEIKS
jgi:HSP20 family protein